LLGFRLCRRLWCSGSAGGLNSLLGEPFDNGSATGQEGHNHDNNHGGEGAFKPFHTVLLLKDWEVFGGDSESITFIFSFSRDFRNMTLYDVKRTIEYQNLP
jgi:hypothetical protein